VAAEVPGGRRQSRGNGRPAVHLHSPATEPRSARTTNAVERLHEEFKRRIKTQTVLPSLETAAMLFWLLASGQITMRKVDGWQTLATKPTDAVIDLAA
jgi:transposase-like protein